LGAIVIKDVPTLLPLAFREVQEVRATPSIPRIVLVPLVAFAALNAAAELPITKFSGAYRINPSGPTSVTAVDLRKVADGPLLEVMAVSPAASDDGFENVLSAANWRSRDRPSGFKTPPLRIRLFPIPNGI